MNMTSQAVQLTDAALLQTALAQIELDAALAAPAVVRHYITVVRDMLQQLTEDLAAYAMALIDKLEHLVRRESAVPFSSTEEFLDPNLVLPVDIVQAAAVAPVSARFDESQWRQTCASLQTAAIEACGMSNDVYVDRLSALLDEEVMALPASERPRAMQIVVGNPDYASPAQRAQSHAFLAHTTLCPHGFDAGLCEEGCVC